MKYVFRCMLAASIDEDDLDNLDYPVYCQAKIDGIRCVILEGRALSRTLKPIPNHFIRQKLESLMLEYPYLIDGELVVGETFQDVSSGIMSEEGEPKFIYKVFDCLLENNSAPYCARLWNMDYCIPTYNEHLIKVFSWRADSKEDVLFHEQQALIKGYEGLIIRDQHAPYKQGRSTIREGALLKLKKFVDAEAIVVDMVEFQHNNNDLESDERGYAKRSSAQANLTPGNKLGALTVLGFNGEFKDVTFNIGSGFTDAERIKFWNYRSKYLGKIVTYKYQKIGSLNKPRIPVFKGFRED